MKQFFTKHIAIFLLLLLVATQVAAAPKQLVADCVKTSIAQTLTRIVQREIKGVPVTVSSVVLKGGKVQITASKGLSYYPVREDNLSAMCDSVRLCLPENLQKKPVELISEGHPLEFYIPLYYRSSDRGVKPFKNDCVGGQLVRAERPFQITKGLTDRHIALWQSHGRYFSERVNDWGWQRSLLWQTVEDLYTQSYVLPYLVPMLERAGATVLLPRERDFQTAEIIADNDGEGYSESAGKYVWSSDTTGFAHKKCLYLSGENPFRDGTSRVVKTTTDATRATTAQWSATFEKGGEYAVYVSYRSLPNSATDALYTVHHAGGESRYRVNQRIGGGTWIYLGTHTFAPGKEVAVTLSNHSASGSCVVSADAVKIGGGYGNIARTVVDSMRVEGVDYTPITSGMPRYCEGARYWLQWAGFDEKVYNLQNNTNDYKDDYMCRGQWVNALMGGSDRLKKEDGLGVPIDLSFAFHTDAGITASTLDE